MNNFAQFLNLIDFSGSVQSIELHLKNCPNSVVLIDIYTKEELEEWNKIFGDWQIIDFKIDCSEYVDTNALIINISK